VKVCRAATEQCELRLAAVPRLNYIDAVEGSLGRHRCYTSEPIGGSDTPDLAPNPDGKSRTPATGRAMNDLPDPDRRVSTRAGSDTSSPLDPKIAACIVPLPWPAAVIWM
jgi:hypothetical protein